MERSKVVAVITGAIALFLGVAYLLIVQLLDMRGEMIPAPQDLSMLPNLTVEVQSVEIRTVEVRVAQSQPVQLRDNLSHHLIA